MYGLVLKLCNTNTKFLEIPMTPIFLQVFSPVQSPADAMIKELRNLAASLCAELSSHSHRFVMYSSYCIQRQNIPPSQCTQKRSIFGQNLQVTGTCVYIRK